MRRIKWGIAFLIILTMAVSMTALGETMSMHMGQNEEIATENTEMSMPMDSHENSMNMPMYMEMAEEEEPQPITAAELIDMIYDPENAELLGKIIQVSGYFDAVRDEETYAITYYLIVAAPGSCCAESITFIPDECCEAFPESGTMVDLTGRLELMEMEEEMDGRATLHIVNAMLSWE